MSDEDKSHEQKPQGEIPEPLVENEDTPPHGATNTTSVIIRFVRTRWRRLAYHLIGIVIFVILTVLAPAIAGPFGLAVQFFVVLSAGMVLGAVGGAISQLLYFVLLLLLPYRFGLTAGLGVFGLEPTDLVGFIPAAAAVGFLAGRAFKSERAIMRVLWLFLAGVIGHSIILFSLEMAFFLDNRQFVEDDWAHFLRRLNFFVRGFPVTVPPFAALFAAVGFGGRALWSLRQRRPSTVSRPFQEQEVGAEHGVFYGSLFAEVGYLVNTWTSLLVGEAERANKFQQAYQQILKERLGVASVVRALPATSGLGARVRPFAVVQRGVATVAVYIATIGDDLYISWRAFVQGQLNLTTVLIWLLMVGFLPVFFSFETTRSGTAFEFGRYLNVLVVMFFAFLGFVVVFGLLFREGDIWGVFRAPLHPFHTDDVSALSYVVHQSIVDAADKAGLDPELLNPPPPPYNPQPQRRI